MNNDNLTSSQADSQSQNVLSRISSVYSTLNEAERRVADYITSNTESARGLAITRIGELAGVSQGTVVRFCRTLGFGGYTDFKLALAEDLSLRQLYNSAGPLGYEGSSEAEDGSHGFVAGNLPKTIGCVGPIFSGEVMARIYVGVEHACRKQDFHVMTANSFNDYEIERDRVSSLAEAGCQAIILYPVTRTNDQLAHDYLKTESPNIPIVLVDIAYPEQMHSQVIFDNYRAGWDMTLALIDHGHTKVAFMLIDSNGNEYMHRSVMDRYQGYIDAMASVGLKPREEDLWKIPQKSFRHLENHADALRRDPRIMDDELGDLIQEKINQSDRATAVIALEDNMAVTVINLARQFGLAIPDDLQVVGFDNITASSFYHQPFPTSLPDFVRAGEFAVDMALREIKMDAKERIVQSYMLPVPIDTHGMVRIKAIAAKSEASLTI